MQPLDLYYNMASLPKTSKNETNSPQSTISKYVRRIEEQEMWRDAKIDNNFSNIKRITNAKLRRKWHLANIESLLFREKSKFYARAKITAAPAYLTHRKEMNETINEAKTKLQEIKDKTKHYKGHHLLEKIKNLRNIFTKIQGSGGKNKKSSNYVYKNENLSW